MPGTPEVPTWQIFPTSGGQFRWSLAGGEPDRRPQVIPETLGVRFPSMADLVRQAPPKLLEPGGGDHTGGVPMFRTGSGRSVSLRESSILKARSVFERGDALDRGDGQATKDADGNVDGFPMFRTGSGKSVTVRQSSVRKAATVLGEDMGKGDAAAPECGDDNDDGFPMFRTGSRKSVTLKQSSLRMAAAVLGEDVEKGDAQATKDADCNDDGFLMFRTGSGKSVTMRQSSVRKAATVLGEDAGKGDAAALECGDDNDDGFPMFQTGSGKSVTLKQSSLRMAAAVLGEDVEKGPATVIKDGDSNDGFPMFRTGSGKSVMVSQSSVRKAMAVLEGDISEKEFLNPSHCEGNDCDVPMFQTGFGKSILVKQSSTGRAISVLQAGDNLETDKTCKLIVDRRHVFSNSFQTGSGKAVNISSAGLSRATTLLGLEGNDNLCTSKYFQHANNKPDMNVMTNEDKAKWNLNSSNVAKYNIVPEDSKSDKRNQLPVTLNFYSPGSQPYKDAIQKLMGSETHASDVVQPTLKFRTAGGKSLSISSDALKRARSLLGDSEGTSLQNVANADQSTLLVQDKNVFHDTSWNKENISVDCLPQNADNKNHSSMILPPLPTFNNQVKPSFSTSSTISRGILDQVEVNGFLSEGDHHASRKMSHWQEPSKKVHHAAHSAFDNSENLLDYCRSPLVDISNNMRTSYANMNGFGNEKKRPQRINTISPFKRPRISRFTTPVNSSISLLVNDYTEPSTSGKCCLRIRVSARYPFRIQRKTLQDFFGGPPTKHHLLRQLPDRVQHMNPDIAETYRFCDTLGSDVIGSENFRSMLLHSGASASSASKEWVANHYKWIVWKLACFERCYPAKASGKFLIASNVLEELKYRYEREVNYGHRSAIKKILDGDASPASMMVLCISSIYSHYAADVNKLNDTTDSSESNQKVNRLDGAESSLATKIELTDGWYSLDATLDVLLSKQLAAGKLFVGQKLRIWGAGLCGWAGPISPLEASKSVRLLIHINGTYRAHWSHSLGFCKTLGGAPLDFRCIKGAGGKVPRTLVGITRIYPVLYKERLPGGGSIVRSERMENKVLQLYNQRRSCIVEDIMAQQHDVSINANDSEEGAKIFRILEKSAEPELLMADMSSEQLTSFSTYQSKQEAIRQSSLQKKIEKTLEDAGLSLRDVTPFMRVRVVSLTSKGLSKRRRPREGLITIWNPTEKQKLDLVEGHIYSVSGLMPLNFGSDILYLQARGCSTMWKPVHSISEKFEPFFTPRKPVLLSKLGEVPLTSEFDIAAVVVHVGEVYISGCQKKQWIFVTDGSKCSSQLPFEDLYDCLLAVSFCSPVNDNDLSGLLSQCLAGTTVAFCNLVKRAKDQMNHLWVAEAAENSTYTVCHSLPKSFHLKEAADSAYQWSKTSSLTIQKLRERILCIVGGQGS